MTKTIEQHEKEKHSETPITWEDLRSFMFMVFVVGSVSILAWGAGNYYFNTPAQDHSIHCHHAVDMNIETGTTTAVLECNDGNYYPATAL